MQFALTVNGKETKTISFLQMMGKFSKTIVLNVFNIYLLNTLLVFVRTVALFQTIFLPLFFPFNPSSRHISPDV